ncbi:MAG: DUF5698 domain-containing protein [Anaerolineaceae bacterium]|nr:DUF5698 domain-containing protein [Anaerolineaceae bacterium]
MSHITSFFTVFTMLAFINIMDTVRMLFVMRGKKFLAGLVGGLNSAIYILAIASVLEGPMTLWKAVSYGSGVSAGIIVGILFEKHLALGYHMLHIFSKEYGFEIASALHKNGHAATLSCAVGMAGDVCIIDCAAARKDISQIQSVIETIDPAAFITTEETTPLKHGYFRPRLRRRNIAI